MKKQYILILICVIAIIRTEDCIDFNCKACKISEYKGTTPICELKPCINPQCDENCYGPECKGQCDSKCNKCDRVGGICTECSDNKSWGDLCQTACSSNCIQSNEFKSLCKISSGDCYACKLNHRLPSCEKCEINFYGSDCDKKCSLKCIYNKEKDGICDKETGACLGCNGNWDGPDCNICKPGFYGPDCLSPCPVGCDLSQGNCDAISGDCKACLGSNIGKKCDICLPQYYGSLCENECPGLCDFDMGNCDKVNGNCKGCLRGSYGLKCEHKCNANCDLNKMNCRLDGTCDYCKEGFYGKNCIDCPKTCKDSKCSEEGCLECSDNITWGEFCEQSCPDNCLPDQVTGIKCDRKVGTCSKCINENIEGDKCEKCKEGFYGKQCENECNENCEGGCDIDGNCFKCKSGFWNKDCKSKCNMGCDLSKNNCDFTDGKCQCSDNFWGDKCSKQCSEKCKKVDGRQCEMISGICTDCEGNFSGKACEVCKIGFRGEKCEETCNQGCDLSKNNCDRDNGKCDCQTGFFGIICDKACSGCLFGCDIDGICLGYTCKDGDYFGLTCQQCSEKCLNSKCDRYSGECNGCIDKKFGKECEKPCVDICKTTECCYKDLSYNNVEFDIIDESLKFCIGDSECFYANYDLESSSILVIPNKSIEINGVKQDIEYYKSSSAKLVGTDLETVEYSGVKFTGYRYTDSMKYKENIIHIEFILADNAVGDGMNSFKAVPMISLGKESPLSLELYENKVIDKDIIVVLKNKKIILGDYTNEIKSRLVNLSSFNYDIMSKNVHLDKTGITLTNIEEAYIHTINLILDRKANSQFIFSRKLLSFFKLKFLGPNIPCTVDSKSKYYIVCSVAFDINTLPDFGLVILNEVYTIKASKFFEKNSEGYVFTPSFEEKTTITFGKDLLSDYEIAYVGKRVLIYCDNMKEYNKELLSLPSSFDDSSYVGVIVLLVMLSVLILIVIAYLLYKKYRFRYDELRAPIVEN